jgi:hypothetical protein
MISVHTGEDGLGKRRFASHEMTMISASGWLSIDPYTHQRACQIRLPFKKSANAVRQSRLTAPPRAFVEVDFPTDTGIPIHAQSSQNSNLDRAEFFICLLGRGLFSPLSRSEPDPLFVSDLSVRSVPSERPQDPRHSLPYQVPYCSTLHEGARQGTGTIPLPVSCCCRTIS